MTFLSTLRAATSGYKTYIIAAMIVLIAIVEGVLGIDIPGVDAASDPLAYILNGLGLGTLRAGVAKAAVQAVLK